MAKYKSKPCIVEAVQWNKDGDHPKVKLDKFGYHFLNNNNYPDVRCGNYILTHSDGSLSVMSEAEFLSKYEKIEERTCTDCGGDGIKLYSDGYCGWGKKHCLTCNGTGKVEE
jgi:DnaJ-class molecular chaperone